MDFTKVKIVTFVPLENVDAIREVMGIAGKLETVDEERIEVVCEHANAKVVISAMKKAHSYEEVAFDTYPLVDESQL